MKAFGPEDLFFGRFFLITKSISYIAFLVIMLCYNSLGVVILPAQVRYRNLTSFTFCYPPLFIIFLNISLQTVL